MIKSLNEDTALKFKTLSPEEKNQRGILGRLYGPVASFKAPTRNQRKYSQELWEKLFESPLIKERFKNGGIFGQLCHPDYSEIDMEKIAIVMPEPPVKDKNGNLQAYVDIVDTPCGQIAYKLAKYGYKFGISSRGEGDLVTDYDGNESVDPDTYTLSAFDLVEIPAVESARLTFTESLDKTRYNKTLRETLQESLDKASDSDRKIMQEALDNLHISLNEKHCEEEEEIPDFPENEEELDEEILSEDEKKSIKMAAEDVACENCDEDLNEAMSFQQELIDNKTGDKIMITGNNQAELTKNVKNFIRTHGGNSRYSEGASQRQNGNTITNREEAETEINDNKNLNEFYKVSNTLSDEDNALIYVLGHLLKVENKSQQEVHDILLKAGYSDHDAGTYVYLAQHSIPQYIFDREEQGLTDTKDESLDINNKEKPLEESVAVENNEAIVEQLQELLKVNANLEQQIMDLQEKLSVSYAKESKIEEEAEKYKNTVKSLAESAREAKALQTKVSTLEQRIKESKEVEVGLKKQLTEAKERINDNSLKNKSLRESISSKSSEVSKLNESIVSLKESLTAAQNEVKSSQEKLTEAQVQHKKDAKINKKLKEQFETEKAALNENIAQLQKDKELQKTESIQKIEKAKKLIEKYKKATATAIDKYIGLQAIRLGSSVNEVKNRLPESYTFSDIDKVCEDLQSYNLNMSRLPFNALSKKSMNENLKVKGTSSKNESILPVSGFDDEIDDDLLYLAGRK